MLNRFNDPEEFHIADSVVRLMAGLKEGELTSVQTLFEEAAPGYTEEDVSLSAIDLQVRVLASKKGLLMEVPLEYRYSFTGRPYEQPFRVRRKK